VIDPDDKAILQAFYDSLTSKGSISWNFDWDLCANPSFTGLTCDDDGKVIILYETSLLLFYYDFI